MSRQSVRQGIANWLAAGTPALRTVYAGLPRVIPATAFWGSATGATHGAVAAVHLPADRERRRALGGANAGWKQLDYTVEIQLFFRYVAPADALGRDAGLEATEQFDALIDSIKARIRSDRTAGGEVWQWGEDQLSGRYGDPTELGDAVDLRAYLTTVATEWLLT